MLATLKRFFSEIHSADHIKLKTSNRPVKPGQAVALSYGIGDFDREKHLFGHVEGLESESVSLEFGGEWEIEGLKSALVSLSEKHGAVWLDQLSIPQDPASITLHLQNMPQIYRGFEVVVLLPNAPCSCLKDAFDSWTSEGLHSRENGDFDIATVSLKCFNAFPVSSYNFRLWTKQEFSFAMTISIYYCGASGKCVGGIFDGSFGDRDTWSQGSGHLSRWVAWKLASCDRMASGQRKHATAMGPSFFMAARDDGKRHLNYVVFVFLDRTVNTSSSPVAHRMGSHVASFLLGKKLHRDPHKYENMFLADHQQSEHVASSPKDFALAVLPAADGYRLPQGHAEMTLPELIEDGIEQYQRHSHMCLKTRLPRGLFEDGITSMGPKPSLHIRTENIRYLRDVYGSLFEIEFPNIAPPIHPVLARMNQFGSFTVPRDPWLTPLLLRDVPPRPSRLTLSKTYAEAFGGASTAEVWDFMRQLPENIRDQSRVKAYRGWAERTYRNEIPAPLARWPSVAHEQAILETCSLDTDQLWESSWPEIDHEQAVYSFMCDYVCIHPDVAREKGLGLVVKTSDPPCIGFVNRVVYDKIRATEQYQHRHGSPAPQLWRRQNGIDPEDWLTITLDETLDETTYDDLHQTLEVIRVNTRRDFPEHPINNIKSRYKTSVPRYVVRGVWYQCLGDDACIGAELTETIPEDYDAILI